MPNGLVPILDVLEQESMFIAETWREHGLCSAQQAFMISVSRLGLGLTSANTLAGMVCAEAKTNSFPGITS